MSSANLHDKSDSSESDRSEEVPGAYRIPFSAGEVERGSRLDSIPPPLRFWAVDGKRANSYWYQDMLQAHNEYEKWLSKQPPDAYPMPFRTSEGKYIGEVGDNLRRWAIHPDRSSHPWYDSFVRANDRYEQHLVTIRGVGGFPYPWGKYKGEPIRDLPQDVVWWALRPRNSHRDWYKPMHEDNKRLLDEKYKSRSPGSEPIWFGKRYRGYRLDQVYERKGFMNWCFDPQRGESGWICRLQDLVHRLQAWRQAHPERSGPRQRRKVPDIQNPVGEAIGPWDDDSGSAGEDDEYERDGFVLSDDDKEMFIEEDVEGDEDFPDDSSLDDDVQDSVPEGAGTSAGNLGRSYRVG